MDQKPSINPTKLAAVVYDDGVAIDALLATFAGELASAGVDVCGILQMPPEERELASKTPMRVRDVETGDIIPICQDLGPGAEGCSLDPARLAEAAARLRRAASRPSQLLIISKFGKQEVEGGGFRDEIAYAVVEGRTVLIAVKRSVLDDWLEFTGGAGTLLDHRLGVLKNWWADVRSDSVAAAPNAAQPPSTG